jgi:hypothetical protein
VVLISNHVKTLAVGKKYHVTCHHYQTYKETVNLKRKYEEGSNCMDVIATITVKQNRLIEMRGPTGPKQSRKTQTVLPTCKDKKCHFGFNVICKSTDGAWFLYKSGSGREYTDHLQDLNLLTSTTNIDDATRKHIQNCSRVSATPSTAMRLAHLMAGEKYSNKQMEHIFEQAKGAVCGYAIIHPDKTTASILLEVIDAVPNHSYLALVPDPNSDLLHVKKTRVCSKKLRKETKKGA